MTQHTADRPASAHLIDAEAASVVSNYAPLPVVITRGQGAWVWDVDDRRYLDGLSGYSALNFGHSNERLVQVAQKQLSRLSMTSRAVHNDQLGLFATGLAKLAQMDRVLPMNTGAEAVESALKIARKWAYVKKGVPRYQAEIIVMAGNFHGRTTTIVSFSDDPDAREDFGPYTPGFVTVPYGDVGAVRSAITPNTAAVLVEPIQGEAGVIIPAPEFLPELRRLCTEQNVLLMADEVQSGLGRTGATFACELAGVQPDLYILGKALGGGLVPLSAVVGRAEVLDVLTPGTHGSTFGGNPLACAIGAEVVAILDEGTYQQSARERGVQLAARLEEIRTRFAPHVLRISVVGLWAGVEISPEVASGKELCKKMLERGVIVKDTHGSTIRLSPPLCSTPEDIDFLCDALAASLEELTA